MSLSRGARLGPYEISEAVGEGGMGDVYRARDTRLDRDVAVKTIKGPFTERFEREARAISALNHPNICTLYDVGEHEGSGYLVMEYIEGKPIAGPLPVEQAIALRHPDLRGAPRRAPEGHRPPRPEAGQHPADEAGHQAARLRPRQARCRQRLGRAVRARPCRTGGAGDGRGAHRGAHGRRHAAVHGAGADRGRARSTRAPTSSRSAACSTSCSPASAPSTGKTASTVMAAVLATTPQPIEELVPLTPPALERIVARCLAKDPDDRWQTARDVAAELQWVVAGRIESRPAGGRHRPAPHARRRRLGRAARLAALAAIGFGVAWVRRAPEPPALVRFPLPTPASVSNPEPAGRLARRPAHRVRAPTATASG